MKKLYISTWFTMHLLFVFGQTNTGISGRVLDGKTQKPLQNVMLSFQNTNRTLLTDANGKFIFESVPVGKQLLHLNSFGYKDQFLSIEIMEDKMLDLGIILLEEDLTAEQQLSLITLTDNDLEDDHSGSESTAGLLQSTKDAFQQAAAFQWGQARFKIRGLDNEYGNTMINGISMNKLYDGRPQWSNWGGLNDATRNQDFTIGTKASDYTFGGALGVQQINTRASFYRPGSRVSFSGTNTNYSWRAMGTYALGMNKKGWSYMISASRRWAQEGYFEGTDYAANSLLASVEKKINDHHSVNLSVIYAQNNRGKNAPNTKEVTDLMGVKYNPYWGWQEGTKRNARDKKVEEPMAMLSHYWKWNDQNTLNTTVSYQTGQVGNTRLEYPGGNNPDPTYYRNLPSYYLNTFTNGVWTPNYEQAEKAKTFFLNHSQLDWNAMYIANQNTATGQSAIAMTEQRNEDTQINANSVFSYSLSDNMIVNAGLHLKNLKSHNYTAVTDLLGGDYLLNTDSFFQGNNAQYDLNNPNQQVAAGGTFGYNYQLFAQVAEAFTQFKFSYTQVDFYMAQSFSRSEYQREGLYRSGNYPTLSFGKGSPKTFENFGFKTGLTYKITGRQLLDFNILYMTKAPNLRNVYSNARKSNALTPGIESESVLSGEASYIIRMPVLKARITGYYSKMQNATEIAFFYAENISDTNGAEDSFVTEITTALKKQNMGLELGLEYQINNTLKATAAAAYGQYIYSDNAHLETSDDALAAWGVSPIKDFGTVYLKNYRQPGMPQQAYSLGLEYRDPRFWWVGTNGNYLSDSYIGLSKIRRTDNFSVENTSGVSYPGVTAESIRAILKQEKFDPIALVNVTGGKSWQISKKNRNTVGFFASINNVFDVIYKTGGFEQSRKATFPDLQADSVSGTSTFGNKYFYGYGRTFFVNCYINF